MVMQRGRNTEVDLPWGWWLRVRDGALEGLDGRRWHSVRDAFWHGHLRFPAGSVKIEQQEQLLRILNAVDRCGVYGHETLHDLLGGDFTQWRFYQSWLASIGLLSVDAPRTAFYASLSAEGRSVMLMLQATRDPDWIDLPFSEIVEAIGSTGPDAALDARERSLKAFERSVAKRPAVFARERIGGLHLVTLTAISVDARMPTMKVIWSHPFCGADTRDDFYGWLAERVDRWDDWRSLAYDRGAASLTQHLFMLILERGRWQP
jgi:hypothetical protein